MSSTSPTIKRSGRGRRIWLLIVLVALAAASWLGWRQWQAEFSSRPDTPAAPSPQGSPPNTQTSRGGGGNRALPVSAGSVLQRDLRLIQPAIGTIQALNTAVVRARVEGELRAIHFAEGQLVKAGQLLAEIDPRSYQVQLAQAEGQLARDEAQLANAQIDLARYRDLAARDSIARQQVDTQEALVKQLAGTIRVDQAAVDNARLLLSYTRITAPISGQVGLRQVDLGNVVKPGDAQGLVTITQTQPISVVFSIPEAALPQLVAGMRAAERPRLEVWDRELRNRLATGQVSSLDNAIDPATGTIRVKAQLENRDGTLYPNQFVNIRLQLGLVSAATVVPTASLQRGAIGSFVYRIADDGTVSVRPIEIAAIEDDWAAVRGSLAIGDRVVTDGADRLREGARVEVIAPSRGGSPGAATPGGLRPDGRSSATPPVEGSPERRRPPQGG
jgi:multidrug efflux system membrane fusion protein